jgi:hypothetical protein
MQAENSAKAGSHNHDIHIEVVRIWAGHVAPGSIFTEIGFDVHDEENYGRSSCSKKRQMEGISLNKCVFLP